MKIAKLPGLTKLLANDIVAILEDYPGSEPREYFIKAEPAPYQLGALDFKLKYLNSEKYFYSHTDFDPSKNHRRKNR